jgi:hypothetical protein
VLVNKAFACFFVVIVCITIFGSAFSMVRVRAYVRVRVRLHIIWMLVLSPHNYLILLQVCGMQYMPGAAAEDGLFFECMHLALFSFMYLL